MITLRQFQVFAQVVRAGSFRRCAEHMGLSQVSVSEHVRALEERLGAPLFDRRPGGPATLTPKGEQAYRRIVDILADIDDLIDDLASSRSSGRRAVAIAMHSFLMRDVQPAINDFKAAHPTLDLRIDLGLHSIAELLELVARRTLDLAYFFALEEADAPSSRLVRREPLAVFVGPGHELASQTIVKSERLRRYPAIHLTVRDPLRSLVSRALASIGIGDSPIGLETDDYGLILTSVRRNQGFVCMFAASADETGLVPLRLDPPPPPLEVRLAARRTAEGDSVLRGLIALLSSPPTTPSA